MKQNTLRKGAKPLLLLATASCSLLLLAACGNSSSQASQKKSSIAVAIASEIETMDSSHSVDTTSSEILNNTEEGLFLLGKNSKLMPGMAKSYKMSKDGKTYTYTLRKNAKWNDGTQVTAKDFVYAWRRNVNPKTAAENAYMLASVKNGAAVSAGKMAPSSLGVKAEGKYKFVVTLEHPVSYFNLLMATAPFYPEEQKVVEKYGKKYGTTASKTAYNGPFKLTNWNGSSNSWKLVPNKSYYNKSAVKLSSVKYQVVKEPSTGLNMFENGQLDQTQLQGEQVQNEKNNKAFKQVEAASSNYIAINMKKASSASALKVLQNQKMRQALSVALNRKAFVKNVLADGSIASTGLTAEGMQTEPGGSTDFAKAAEVSSLTTFNAAKATKLWKQGLSETGLSSVSLTLTVDDTDTYKSIGEYLQNQWQKYLPGLKLTIRTVPKTTRVQYLMDGNFDLVMTGWNAEYNDPATYLNLEDTGNTYNFGGYENANYHKLMTTVNNSTNKEARWKAMVAAQKQMTEDMPVVPLFQQTYSYLRNPKMTGLVENLAGAEPGWRGVYMK